MTNPPWPEMRRNLNGLALGPILGGSKGLSSRWTRRPAAAAKGAKFKLQRSAFEKLLWSLDRTVGSTPPPPKPITSEPPEMAVFVLSIRVVNNFITSVPGIG